MDIFKKLVRDRIPEIIEKNGENCHFTELNQKEFVQELRKKFKEEVDEYLNSTEDTEAIEELADVLEIIHSLSELHNKTFDEVDAVRRKKLLEHGGFKKKYFLISAR